MNGSHYPESTGKEGRVGIPTILSNNCSSLADTQLILPFPRRTQPSTWHVLWFSSVRLQAFPLRTNPNKIHSISLVHFMAAVQLTFASSIKTFPRQQVVFFFFSIIIIIAICWACVFLRTSHHVLANKTRSCRLSSNAASKASSLWWWSCPPEVTTSNNRTPTYLSATHMCVCVCRPRDDDEALPLVYLVCGAGNCNVLHILWTWGEDTVRKEFFLIRVKKLLEYYVKTYLHSSACKITYASSQRVSSIIHALESIFTVLSFTWHRM